MKYKLFFFLISILAISCTADDDTEVQIRLANISEFDYTNITIRNGISYEDLEAGEVSEYQTFESSYSYMFVQLVANQDTLFIQPIDFVGESLIRGGNYTYEIEANFENNDLGSLRAILVRD
ncbi:hypothetical protein GCM10011344_09210 [Dokdonia pacifica]|uniref:DUF4377 domain-containing protein n=1 Tax=Dokdonia pacifica TaxID=1627892 RepID=A0A238YS15_9FLAO|nr:hypothetical protein [Dokdonia pacifica]GGG10690.1 hypothetical protein GCM10011344_09210 [Dokdonia pacifica]SNR73393.1 hypothetical protein SAMN06265376_102277 [Dokdonia pacifica]